MQHEPSLFSIVIVGTASSPAFTVFNSKRACLGRRPLMLLRELRGSYLSKVGRLSSSCGLLAPLVLSCIKEEGPAQTQNSAALGSHGSGPNVRTKDQTTRVLA
jgi:hypothetical protein